MKFIILHLKTNSFFLLFRCVMFCFFPEENILLKKVNFCYFLRKFSLKRCVKAEALHNYTKSKRLWSTDQRLSKKNFIHALRYLDFSIQILKSHSHENMDECRCKIDFKAMNIHWDSIQNLNSWEEIFNYCKPIYDEFILEIDKLTDYLPFPSNVKIVNFFFLILF